MALQSETLIADIFCDSCKPYVDALTADRILDLLDVYQLGDDDWQDLRQRYDLPIGWKVFLILKAKQAYSVDGEEALRRRDQVVQQRIDKEATQPKIEINHSEIKAKIQKQATIRMEANQQMLTKGPQPVAAIQINMRKKKEISVTRSKSILVLGYYLKRLERKKTPLFKNRETKNSKTISKKIPCR